VSTSAASHLPPAYPSRAPWGTAGKLRAWQEQALETYLRTEPRDFLAVATPGAGKTTFALRIASDLLHRRVVQAITVIAPTEHLKTQWAEAAARVGISIDPDFSSADGLSSRDFDGIAVTYAGVAAHPMLHRRRVENRRTLVILDELHHAGDALSWGEACAEAFEPATRRLALTGTPFRSDTNPIPFVSYVPGPDGVRRSAADYTYGYGHALRDGVVRPVIFLSYSGQMRWRTKAGDEVAATLGEPMTQDAIAQAWRTALDPHGDWIPQVLAAADRRLSEVRRAMPDAGGLVIAADHAAARAYAAMLRSITGDAPSLVLSDDPKASGKIAGFSESDQRWMVAVRMVSEGVDVPRLAVGVYATSVSTPLFFAQAVGRFVRARRRGETASIFIPSVPHLLGFAGSMEVERDHVLDRDRRANDEDWNPEEALLAQAEARKDGPGEADQLSFEALESAATFDRVLYDGGEFGMQAEVGSAEEQDYLGLPGLLEPDQVSALLRKRQAKQIERERRQAGAAQTAAKLPADERPVVTHRQLTGLRRELNTLVGAWHHRTGKPHGTIHGELRRACGGGPTATLTAAELQTRIDTIRRWATQG
jgi:superfamily II DNA or RNA helicase